ncbi:hypothetical protein BBP00_00007363 [Phytophthora kernoviae]|uniref:Jacalin-type lectin domain-containing protein n=3 Tax=Phytophthora kernoviae TaxID=325452 RepID=A0A3F2RIC2_9STRA|nr:hypothetical protein BBP00_00007363 [Phytophthora kernoviae]
MGKRISDWDIVNIQEDFNYHAFLYSKNTHEHRTATSGGVPFGSGLNTLSHYPFTNVSGTERTQWKACSSNEGADCLTPKGFTRVEIQLDEGVAFDLYNLHSDAGTSAEDQKARASNLAQLGDYIKANSADKAVIVMGDTNTRYTRSLDTIAEFLQGTNLTDGWVEFVRNGKTSEKGAAPILCDKKNMTNECEVVDKIMYRGNNYITLTLDKWNNDNKAFLDSNKTGLSDHPPISSVFSWKLNPDLHLSDAFGGPHGTPFTDVALAAAGQTVSSITIRAEKRVDGVSLEVSDPTESTLAHGGTGGTPKKLQLKSGEYITSMEVHWGKKEERTRIFYLKFKTNKGRSVEGGTKTSAKATVTAPKGFQLSGLHGRSDKEVDALEPDITFNINTQHQSNLDTMATTSAESSTAALQRYGAFVEEVLRPQLKEILARRDALAQELQEYRELQELINELGQNSGKCLNTLMDIGERFHVRAKVPDTSLITVDIGLNFHVEMTISEARKFVQQHLLYLTEKRNKWQQKAREVSEHVNLVIASIQQLAALQ